MWPRLGAAELRPRLELGRLHFGFPVGAPELVLDQLDAVEPVLDVRSLARRCARCSSRRPASDARPATGRGRRPRPRRSAASCCRPLRCRRAADTPGPSCRCGRRWARPCSRGPRCRDRRSRCCRRGRCCHSSSSSKSPNWSLVIRSPACPSLVSAPFVDAPAGRHGVGSCSRATRPAICRRRACATCDAHASRRRPAATRTQRR